MKGKTIYFRALEPEDIQALYDWENDPEIQIVSNHSAPFSKHTLTEYINASHLDIYTVKQVRLIIAENETHKAVGTIELFDYDPKNERAGVGILIDKDFRTKGYATEALRLIKTYAFKTLRLHQIYCNITASNTASIKLFTKAGFQLCGTKKEWTCTLGKWEDEHIFQLINTITIYSKN